MSSKLPGKRLLLLLAAASVAMPIWRASIALAQETETASLSAKEIADEASNPYAVIVERNIFHLTNPPPPPEKEVKQDLPVVKITGFLNIGSVSRVLFISEPKDKKDGPSYYSLAEGEMAHDNKNNEFQLVKIHPSKDAVDVINAGTPMTLTVKENSLAPSTDTGTKAGGQQPAAGPPGPQPPPMPGRPPYPGQHRHGGPGEEGGGPPNRGPIPLPQRMQRGQ